jgi:hypothetical protein
MPRELPLLVERGVRLIDPLASERIVVERLREVPVRVCHDIRPAQVIRVNNMRRRCAADFLDGCKERVVGEDVLGGLGACPYFPISLGFFLGRALCQHS